jgi:hypothetical protein
MRRTILMMVFSAMTVWAQTSDSAAIRQAALDYAEGWYAGDAARMEKALHPELAKRIVHTDEKSGRNRIEQMSALTLINGTKGGFGKNTPREKQFKDVFILDIFAIRPASSSSCPIGSIICIWRDGTANGKSSTCYGNSTEGRVRKCRHFSYRDREPTGSCEPTLNERTTNS